MFDIAKMMAQAKKVQDRMEGTQTELADTTIIGQSSCGNVVITCNGKFEFTNVEVKPEWGNGATAEEIQTKTLEALQDITNQIMGITESKMKELTQGINIPGLKLPF